MKSTKRLLICLLCLCLCLPVFASCSAPEGTVEADTVVGSVDGIQICYDELYFLVTSYKDTAKELAGGDTLRMGEELDRIVKEQIVANAAILKLCEQVGLDYPERDSKKDAEAELEATISSDFEGDEDAFSESLAEVGLTRRYVLYATQVDLMYQRLLSHYPETGLVSDDEAEIRSYIEKNFVRTIHVMNSDLAQITEAYEKLQSGSMTMFKAIGSVYNKDFNSVSDNGYYFARGTMDEAYEEAALALSPGQISGVVTATAEIGNRLETAYYIIQRLELEEDYITENLSTLQSSYYSSVIYDDMQDIREDLIFAPSEFYTTLDLTDLALPYETSDLGWVIPCVIAGVAVIALGIAIPVIVIKRKHAKKNVSRRRAA